MVRKIYRRFGANVIFAIHFIAIKVGVPVVPGTPGPVAKYTDAETFIKEYGFPGASLPPGRKFLMR